ncbi:hypothetical protein AB5J62_06250 [Amycolatopsis sp. cg5]|uniref:hypothetical protein n=1 Tax=Amycolatopsis sp. cg5 TaxID=3238802 RepID=UPI003523FAC0
MGYLRSVGKHRKRATIGIASVLGVAGIATAIFTSTTPSSEAAESCQGLDTALGNNLKFIADQKASPDQLSEARIANRQAVVDLIQQRRKAAGCTGAVAAPIPLPQPEQPPAAEPEQPAAEPEPVEEPIAAQQVCQGATVTLSGEAGAPAVTSNQFPVGTRLKVTNLDNAKSTTVAVSGPSGSCALLNNAAFEQVREPGKFLIRRARIERVG